MKSAIAGIAIAVLVITLIVSPFGIIISALLGQFAWTTTFILTMFGSVAIVFIASKVMDRQEASA